MYRRITLLFKILSPFYDVSVKLITFNLISKLKRRTITLAITTSSDEVLDVATGTGLIALELSKVAKQVYGVDLSKSMLKLTLKKAKAARLENMHLIIAEVEHLPFRSELFNASTCSFAMHHFQSPTKALKEMLRTIKLHGRMVFLDVVNPDSFVSKIMFTLYWMFIELGTSRHLTIQEWRSLFRKMRLNNIRTETFGLFLIASGEKHSPLQIPARILNDNQKKRP